MRGVSSVYKPTHYSGRPETDDNKLLLEISGYIMFYNTALCMQLD